MINNIISALFGSITVAVTPEELYSTSEKILNEIQTVKKQFDSINGRIKSTASYWEGRVSDYERKKYEENIQSVNAMINNLNNYVTELKVIASNYALTESEAAEASLELPANILS